MHSPSQLSLNHFSSRTIIFELMKPETFLSRYLGAIIVKQCHRLGTQTLYDQYLEKHPKKFFKNL